MNSVNDAKSVNDVEIDGERMPMAKTDSFAKKSLGNPRVKKALEFDR